MKKLIILSCLALSFAGTLSAQRTGARMQKTGNSRIAALPHFASKGAGGVSGTIFPASFGTSSACATSIGVYRDSTFGYFTGINTYGDEELLMRYSLAGNSVALPAKIDTVIVFFGAKYIGSNGSVRAKVYAADASGEPATLLGTSADISVFTLDTSGAATKFVFPAAVNLTTDKFFVGVDVSSLYSTSDTVGIFSTDANCASTDPLAAWTRESDDNFYAFSDQNNNWGFSVDMAIFAHYTAQSLAVNNVSTAAFGAGTFPNPATGKLTVAFTGIANDKAEVTIKDISGKIVSVATLATTIGKAYRLPFDVSSLSPGLYFVEVSSAGNKAVMKAAIK